MRKIDERIEQNKEELKRDLFLPEEMELVARENIESPQILRLRTQYYNSRRVLKSFCDSYEEMYVLIRKNLYERVSNDIEAWKDEEFLVDLSSETGAER